MKVSESNSELIDYSKKLNDRLKNQTINKEREIETIKSIYEKRIDDTKIEGEDRYINALKKNDEQLIGASKDYEDKLNGYKENLEKTQKMINQEENSLKLDQAQKMETSKDQFRSNIDNQIRNASEQQNTINQQTQNKLNAINGSTRMQKNQLEMKANTEINNLSNEYNQKGISTERDFRSNLDNNIRMHQEDLNLQKNELRKLMDKNAEKNKRLEDEKLKVQANELNYLDLHQKDLINQKQNDFKIRYENMVKENEAILSELKIHFDKDVKKMVVQNAAQKNNLTNKNEDSFYRVETLKPKIQDNPKEMLVSIEVQEHEKENVHLSAHGRVVKLTLTRKFSDSIADELGGTNKSTRTELFSKDFPTKDILNSKEITQKYENGILSFKIAKL
jgi:hypothetical protein